MSRIGAALGGLGRSAGLAALVALLSLGGWSLLPLAVGWIPAVVVSGSMTPAVRAGDLVFYQRSDGTDVRPGRIVLADQPGHPGRLLSHRVVSVNPDGTITTKGDANPTVDSDPLPPGAIHGQARLVVPYIGLLTLVDRPEQRPRVALFVLVVLLAATYRPTRRAARPATRYRARHERAAAGSRPVAIGPDPSPAGAA
jgi:signal peptidase I